MSAAPAVLQVAKSFAKLRNAVVPEMAEVRHACLPVCVPICELHMMQEAAAVVGAAGAAT